MTDTSDRGTVSRPTVAVIGAGPAGLMAAEVAAHGGAAVTVYDRMASPGRKFLLAGRGGLNLTHSETLDRFLHRYGAAEAALRPGIEAFSPTDLRAWCEALGQPTFVGTSGRVFPVSLKASPLLRAWLKRLGGAGVGLRTRHRWTGWDDEGALLFETPEGIAAEQHDATILALGGASWPHLGSDGAWTTALTQVGIPVAPLRPSNCGFTVAWTAMFRDRFEGEPLKGIALLFGGRMARGELMVTHTGLEGGAIYALSAALRDAIEADGEAVARIALRPDLDPGDLAARLAERPHKVSLSTFLRKRLKLSPVAIALLNEARFAAVDRSGQDGAVETLARLIAGVPVRLTGTAPLPRAISTAGGVTFGAIDPGLMLRGRPGTFAAGEMLDWEAPTGGYLLQGAFSTGVAAARGALAWLREQTSNRQSLPEQGATPPAPGSRVLPASWPA